MKKNTIIASVVAAFAATAASAGTIVAPVADPVIMVAPTPVASRWDGFYAGATVGWNTGETLNLPPPGTTAFDGLTYGGFIGYNYVMDGGFMVGGELAATIVNMDDAFGTWEMTVFDAKLRAGFEMDRALVYVSGGYSTYIDGGVDGTGWNVGAGVDYLVTDNVFVGAEYVYRDITDSLVTPAGWQDQFHTFQIRAGIKF